MEASPRVADAASRPHANASTDGSTRVAASASLGVRAPGQVYAYAHMCMYAYVEALVWRWKSRHDTSSPVAPSPVKPSPVTSRHFKSSHAKSSHAKSSQAKSSQTKSSQAKSSQAKSRQVQSIQVKSSQVQSIQFMSIQVQSSPVTYSAHESVEIVHDLMERVCLGVHLGHDAAIGPNDLGPNPAHKGEGEE